MAPETRSQADIVLSILNPKFAVLDPDILECPICSEDLAPPVYQCPSGHTTCEACWEKIGGTKCPSCQKPIRKNRNIAVEKILDSLLVSCKNSIHGCPRMLRYTKKASHESTLCDYQPFNCLFDGCKFEGSIHPLSLHFKEEHQVDTVKYDDQFTMKPTNDYILFLDRYRHHLLVVHREKQNLLSADMFFYGSFGPSPGRLNLVIRVKDGPYGSYTLETEGCDIRKGDEWKRNYLLVPESAHGLGNCEFQGQLEMPTIFKKKRRLWDFDD